MPKPTAVSLDELRDRLAGFEQAFEQCNFIDDWFAYQRCRDLNQIEINRIKARIREIEKDARR